MGKLFGSDIIIAYLFSYSKSVRFIFKSIIIRHLILLVVFMELTTMLAMAQSDSVAGVPWGKRKYQVQPLGRTAEIIVVDGDTIVTMNLPMVSIVQEREFKNARDERRFWKLVRDVKKTLPYAKIVGVKLNDYEKQLKQTDNEVKKKLLMKKAEKELKKEFEGDIKNLTLNQGRILIKLIDRETGNTSYELIKELRGGLTAFFWQSIALIFSTNLKNNYDAAGEDQLIEEIVLKVEKGEL